MKKLVFLLAGISIVLLFLLYFCFHDKVFERLLRKQQGASVQWQSHLLSPEKFLQNPFEFEVDVAEPRAVLEGISLVEYEGQEIVVCFFFRKKYAREDASCGFIETKAYDFHGQQLQISQATLNGLVADMTRQLIFERDFNNTYNLWFDRITQELFLCRDLRENIRMLNYTDVNERSKHLVWTHHFSEYTDFSKEWTDDEQYISVDTHLLQYMRRMSALPYPGGWDSIISFLEASESNKRMQLWGINTLTGEELFTITFPHADYNILCFNTTRQHSVASVLTSMAPDTYSYYFFQTWNDLQNDNPAFVYAAPAWFTKDHLFFLNDDTLCLDIARHGRSEHAVLLYSFAKNEIIAGLELNQMMFDHGTHWISLSKDRKKLVLSIEKFNEEPQYLQEDSEKITIRIYDLDS